MRILNLLNTCSIRNIESSQQSFDFHLMSDSRRTLLVIIGKRFTIVNAQMHFLRDFRELSSNQLRTEKLCASKASGMSQNGSSSENLSVDKSNLAYEENFLP